MVRAASRWWVRCCAVAVLVELAFITVSLVGHGSETTRAILANVVYPLGIAVATAAAYAAARRSPRSRRRWWWLVFVANLLWLASNIYWTAYELIGRPVETASIGDVALVGSYLGLILSVGLGFTGRGALRQLRGQLDGLFVAVASGVAGWQLLVAPQLHGQFTVNTLVDVVYPLLDVACLAVFLSVGLSGQRRVPPQIALVVGGVLLSTGADVLNSALAMRDIGIDDAVNRNLYFPVVLLFAVGALWDARGQRDVAESAARHLEFDLGFWPFLLAVGGVLGWAGQDALDGRISRPVLGLVAVTIIGLTLRAQLSIRDQRRVARQLDAALAEQRRLAMTDGLTGLHNRRFGEETLHVQAERALRDGTDLGVIIIDLDHFKAVNDGYGHDAGDAVLAESAARLAGVLRSDDVLVRWGGEEFLAITPGTGAADLAALAERLRRALADQPVRLPDGAEIPVTASLGAAALPLAGVGVKAVVRAADERLYAAKSAGRNRAVTDSAPEPRPVAVATEEPPGLAATRG
ncbi:diguanylate cyclase (GGDEF)-like protein [Krasilnikovia cinnamomea]|uniref:Diguanylate cyclase (GGDEF)-like protein n=1 Tax=Krasilnikovia cinnamomea TaxID=349313 RepID=A0A4Q7ZJ77_9ACTN|nr:GGDEF domain-containing protein [Krasilnikovia cinnamomea]RZU50927.1 diguanylate cyclase (GGDEF)-like protein [Krasilnikovia cinnamomea]